MPKGLANLGRRPLVRWSAEALSSHPASAGLVAVAPPGLAGAVEAALEGLGARVVEGGARRQDSALRGLEAAARIEAGADLVHDAARPFVPPEVIDRLLAALARGADAAVPGLPPAETVKRVEARGADRVVETPPRDLLRAVGTPQALRRPRGLEAFRRRAAGPDTFTDCAAVLEAEGADVRVVAGDARASKITTPADLALAEAALGGGSVRAGIGWDSHRFADGRRLVLGGVRIDHPRGLDGHSDADALAHAVADAVLGAARLGDIGALFPPGDPAWKDADSIGLLRRVAERARAAGWAVANVDAVVVAEDVRIAPHRAAMEANLAAALGVAPDAVSVKGKTAERMGALGRGEGIAAEAVVLLRRA